MTADRLLAVAVLSLCGVVSFAPYSRGAAREAADFAFFDATLYSGKPDLAVAGLRPLRVVYERELLGGKGRLQEAVGADGVIRRILSSPGTTDIVCLDIERWIRGLGSDDRRPEDRYLEVLRRFRAVDDRRRYGFYGLLPIRDYWRAVASPDSDDFQAWRRENEDFSRLGEAVDVVFPSLYTFYRDPDGWRRYAKAQIEMARTYGKPVYAFLWPVFHDSNRRLGGRYIGDAYWRMELETVHALADGLVIWGGWGKDGRRPWDPEAAWWRVTRAFIDEVSRTRGRSAR